MAIEAKQIQALDVLKAAIDAVEGDKFQEYVEKMFDEAPEELVHGHLFWNYRKEQFQNFGRYDETIYLGRCRPDDMRSDPRETKREKWIPAFVRQSRMLFKKEETIINLSRVHTGETKLFYEPLLPHSEVFNYNGRLSVRSQAYGSKKPSDGGMFQGILTPSLTLEVYAKEINELVQEVILGESREHMLERFVSHDQVRQLLQDEVKRLYERYMGGDNSFEYVVVAAAAREYINATPDDIFEVIIDRSPSPNIAYKTIDAHLLSLRNKFQITLNPEELWKLKSWLLQEDVARSIFGEEDKKDRNIYQVERISKLLAKETVDSPLLLVQFVSDGHIGSPISSSYATHVLDMDYDRNDRPLGANLRLRNIYHFIKEGGLFATPAAIDFARSFLTHVQPDKDLLAHVEKLTPVTAAQAKELRERGISLLV